MMQAQHRTESLIVIQMLTEQQVSEVTNIPLPTLRNDRFRQKGFPYVRKGTSIRYRLTDIEKYIEQNTVHPDQQAA